MQVLFLCLTIFLWETSKECLNTERDGISWTHWVNLCSHKGWSSETRNNQRTGGQRVNNRILIDNWQCNCINFSITIYVFIARYENFTKLGYFNIYLLFGLLLTWALQLLWNEEERS